MKKLLLALCMLAGVVLSGASPAPKSIVIGKKSIMELKPGNFVILLPAKPSKVLKFAASELQTILSQAMGAKIPVTTAPQPGKHHIRLGITPEAVKAGLDPEKLIRDGFYIRTVGKDIFIAGKKNSSVFCLNVHSIKRTKLIGNKAFQSEQARNTKINKHIIMPFCQKIRERITPLPIINKILNIVNLNF